MRRLDCSMPYRAVLRPDTHSQGSTWRRNWLRVSQEYCQSRERFLEPNLAFSVRLIRSGSCRVGPVSLREHSFAEHSLPSIAMDHPVSLHFEIGATAAHHHLSGGRSEEHRSEL